MIELTSPWALLLVLIPLLVRFIFPAHKQSRDSVQVPFFARLVSLSGETPSMAASILQGRRIQTLALCISWACLVLAAAGPEWVGEPIEVKKSARDLMVAVDLSGSMEAEDFITADGKKVNRLQAVKSVLDEFSKRRDSDRLGLILFGSAAYLQVPFTTDRDTWLTLLNESEISMSGPSTAMGDAIGLAISHFENSATEHRVLLVLTDGNDTSSRVPPIDAARVASAHHVKVYTIAIGDPATVGEEAMDVETLQKVAEITHGAYFEALDREALESAYKHIDALEPQLYDTLSYRPRHSLFHYPLAVIAMLYLLLLPLLVLAGVLGRRKVIHV